MNKQKPKRNLYEVLGVNKRAKQNEIKKAYYDLAKQYHPDKFATENLVVQSEMTATMAEISEAYSILSDKKTRAEYDKTGMIPNNMSFEQEVDNMLNMIIGKAISAQTIKTSNFIRHCEEIFTKEINNLKDQITGIDNYVDELESMLKIKGKTKSRDSKKKQRVKTQFAYIISESLIKAKEQLQQSNHLMKVIIAASDQLEELEGDEDQRIVTINQGFGFNQQTASSTSQW